MQKWLLNKAGWIGAVASIAAAFFYVISFTGLSKGIGEVAPVLANAWALGVQLLELTGMLVAMAGIIASMDKKGRQAFAILQITIGFVFALDVLAVFIGYGDFRNLPDDTFRAIVAGATRIVISIVAAIGPEGLTTIAAYLLWLSWMQYSDPAGYKKHLEENAKAHEEENADHPNEPAPQPAPQPAAKKTITGYTQAPDRTAPPEPNHFYFPGKGWATKAQAEANGFNPTIVDGPAPKPAAAH